jgi:rhodanese-related sulfurtransferase
MKHAPEFLKLVGEAMPRIREISTGEVKSMLERLDVFLLVDVREDNEWQAGRIPGAIHLGRGIIERDIEHTVPDKAAKLVLYCGGGYRSALAADSLRKMGYWQVCSMAGGFREWQEKNYPQAS